MAAPMYMIQGNKMGYHRHENNGPKKQEPKKFANAKRKVTAVKDDVEIERLQAISDEFDVSSAKTFKEFPLSQKTIRGLEDSGFSIPTEIQKESIGIALKNFDILGAAKTGSGKTLAFLVPVLELLFKLKWSRIDGLGALIITPTRELAYQIFEILKKVGRYHDFSAGLIIGGKDLKYERTRLDQCNIMICTPGRLLHHMDENPHFDCTNMKILILDEADRILDLGFQKSVNAILENIPPDRQTLLFSATQTKSVKDLARLSLKDPVYVSVHEHSQHSTPEFLQQSYIVCELHEKLDMMWSFVKHHLKQKILVFLSSCKQVKYIYEIFCRMRPGMSVLALYGSLHQLRRMKVYDEFCHKTSAVLFATDIAARGLDFPAVNWVVQLDCPEDANTYIHRAGRTARYQKGGESLLILLPSEEQGMIDQLTAKKVPINKIKVNPNKQHTVQKKLESCLARDVNLKESAQRAFVAYLKSVFLMKNKEVFNVQALNTDAYSCSLGLAVAPRIRFLQRAEKLQKAQKLQKEAKKLASSSQENGSKSMEDPSAINDNKAESDEDNAPDKLKPYSFGLPDESDEDLLTVTRTIYPKDNEDKSVDDEEEEEQMSTLQSKKALKKAAKTLTKVAVAKKMLKKKIKPTIVKFNDEGEEDTFVPRQQLSEMAKASQEKSEGGGINIEMAKKIMKEEDKIDRKNFHERVKAKHREERWKKKEINRAVHEKTKSDESEEDDDDEEEEESDSIPELSEIVDALPDPDKYYGKKKTSDLQESSEDEDASSEEEDEEEEDKVDESFRIKRKQQQSSRPTKKQKVELEHEVLDTGLALADDEELALHLLSSR